MARNKEPLILRMRPVISENYREQNIGLHKRKATWGSGGAAHAEAVVALVERFTSQSILDYGCGKGMLGRALQRRGWWIEEYDPAIEGKDEWPEPADIVVCTDVLEHVEPECLHAVLDHLALLTKVVGYFVIFTQPASNHLPDGRNAHQIVQPHGWWADILSKKFVIENGLESGGISYFYVRPKGEQ